MNYVSTRDTSKNPVTLSSAEAIKKGLADDKGLFMPTEIPSLSDGNILRLAKLGYAERATEILSLFLTDYDKNELHEDCLEAYSEARFPGGAAPLKSLGQIYPLELWHGPTCAFKDMALQIMPRLLSRALKMTGETRLAHILVATSGDTGKAALEGYRDVDGVKITVFYPVDGVSKMQKMQMTTQEGANVNVCSVVGNFDDAQSGVKAIFADKALAERAESEGFFFSSANSINWGRLAPQIVYYISAYCDMINNGDIKLGDEVNICVPTGNFGNIFAAYIAKRMGLPFHRLICASNANNVLTDFMATGTYDRTREFHKTMSPSMDILISSNLERLLYTVAGAEVTKDLMDQLAENGKYTVPADIYKTITDNFSGYYCSEDETAEVIARTFGEKHYLADTHTAVGLGCAEKYIAETDDSRKIILASTASPYKFTADVCTSLGLNTDGVDVAELLTLLSDATGTEIPTPLMKTLTLPIRFTKTVDAADMPEVVFEK